MPDVARALERAADAHLRTAWTPERAARLERGLPGRALRRRRAQVITAAAAVALVAVGMAVVRPPRHAPAPLASTSTTATSGTQIRLADGSRVLPLDPHTALGPTTTAGAITTAHLERGAARFVVTHDPSRVFRVEAGDVAVQVLGTVFVVDRGERGVSVWVESGRVRVFAGARLADLAAGEHAFFAHDEAVAAAPSVPTTGSPTAEDPGEPAPAVAMPPPVHHSAPATPTPTTSWRTLAASGNYREAYAAMHRSATPPPRDDAEDLMQASDAARFSGHPDEAVGYLRQVVRRHASDARAPLAAMTMGGLLLRQLGRPRDAADAFARVRTLDQHSGLFEDALAHEVESLSDAGDIAAAQGRADEYRQRYPAGHWLTLINAHCHAE